MSSLAADLGLSPEVIRDRLDILELGAADCEALREAAPAVLAGSREFISGLYERLGRTPATAAWFVRPDLVARLHTEQSRYLSELFSASLDWDYVLRRLRIGEVHHRVRLPPRWYVATCCHFITGHLDVFFSPGHSRARALDQTIALVRRVMFDAALVLDAYGMQLEQAMRSGQAGNVPEPASGHGPASGNAPVPSGVAQDPPPLMRMQLHADDREERLRFLDIDEPTLEAIRLLPPVLDEALPGVMDDFYQAFRRWPVTAGLLPEEVITRLTTRAAAYWRELAGARFGRAYVASRTRVGVVHEQVGISSQIYLIGLGRQLARLVQAIARVHADPRRVIEGLLKAVFFDVSYVMDAYLEARAATVLRSEGYASQLLASLTIGVAVLDDNQRVRSANPALLRLLGVEAGLVRHMRIADLIPDPGVESLVCRTLEDGSGRQSVRLAYAGRHLRVSVVDLVEAAEGSRSSPRVVLVEDLSDLVALAPEVDVAEVRLAQTVAAVDAVLWEAEAHSWMVVVMSKPVLGLTGLPALSFLGHSRTWLSQIPEPDRTRLVTQCNHLALDAGCVVTHRITHASGATRWVRTQVRRRGGSLDASVFCGITIDVTQAFLEDRRRLESVGRLAGSIAHEFNGLLTIVAGSIGLLRDCVDPTGLPDLDAMARAVGRGASLTRQLQAFARGVALRAGPCVLNETLGRLEADFKRQMGDSVEVRLAMQPDLWPCEIDRQEFESVMVNLLSNARDAMPRGGRLEILTRNLRAEEIIPTPALDHPEDFVEVAVTDTGTGMEEEVRRHAVEPFFSTKTGSVGLGLSVIHGFVRQNRGHMLIESRVNSGTSVRLRFPRLTSRRGEAGPQSGGAAARRIFVIDDDPSLLAVVERMLARRGYAVRTFAVAREARLALERETPDLVLCDVMFDGRPQGAELGIDIKAMHPGLPFIHMSGYTWDALNLAAEDLFLAKPFSLEELDAALRRALPTSEGIMSVRPPSGGASR